MKEVSFFNKLIKYLKDDEDYEMREELLYEAEDLLLEAECYRDELERHRTDAFGRAKYKRIT